MNYRSVPFELARRIFRAVPSWIRGKTRLAHMAVRLFDSGKPICIPDQFGNALWCPSLREPMAAALFAAGVYEPDTVAGVISRLTPHGVYLDVGANIGAIALPVAALRSDVTVVCVEADPKIVAVLQRNATENRRANVIAVNCVAAPHSSDGKPFYPAPEGSFGMGSVVPRCDAAAIIVEESSLDDLLDRLGIPSIAVVKLDIEGAELGALKGLQRRLTSADAPAVIFEFVDWAEARIPNQAAGDAQAWLLQLGYRLFLLGRDGAIGPPVGEPIRHGFAMLVALPPHARLN